MRSTAGVKTPFRIGLLAGQLSAAELTNPILTAFARHRPDLDLSLVELSFANQVSAVTDGLVDVALLRPPYADTRLRLTAVYEEPRLLCCSADHVLADADTLAVADVLDHPVLKLENAAAGWSDFWQMNDLRGEPGQTTTNSSVTVGELQIALSDSDSVISIAASGWRLGIHSPYLRAIPIEGVSGTPVAVAVAEDRQTRQTRDFTDCAREVCAGLIDVVPGARPA